MFVELKDQVQILLQKAAASVGYNLSRDDILFEVSEHADLSTRLAFQLMSARPESEKEPKEAGKEKENPAKLAAKIVAAITPEDLSQCRLVQKITTTGPYINIFASDFYLSKTVENTVMLKEKYGTGKNSGKILLEHTSANPNGPLHVGHIRNSTIGDTLSRILKKSGYDVEVQYYVNDIGRQIAVVSWACSRYKLDTSKKSDSAIADVYIQANADLSKDESINKHIEDLMKKVESGDKETIDSFTTAVDLAVSGIQETLTLLNVKHDKFIRESKFIENGDVWRIIDDLKKTGKTKDENGALVVDLSDYGFEKTLVIQRSNKTSLYTTRDLAYHEWKGPQCDRMIDVFGADHKLISGQLRAALDLLGQKIPEVVIFEFVSLPEGSMSTRRGVFISADELLEEMMDKAYEEIQKRRPEESEEFKRNVARMVGVGATRYDIIKVSPEKSTVFDWKTALDFEKQGAPFIQYSHARASNILNKAKEEGLIRSENDLCDGSVDFDLLIEPHEIAFIKRIARFEHVIMECARELKPHPIAIYARELADDFNQFYRYVPVLNVDDWELRKSRLALVYAGKIAISNVLFVLGIDAPDSM
ncbi:arginine--tRNA ligase [Methanolapillus ohkumae]|uniref:Arginine--tRNA ligase n=1 Tax=Methanolapillus ohkumae TaxID=3028298 RepID=A0AA96ZWD0_9EURY|nr:Arginine--tRNA ligase [Methanosarcinaceae archaeon Am2]